MEGVVIGSNSDDEPVAVLCRGPGSFRKTLMEAENCFAENKFDFMSDSRDSCVEDEIKAATV